jgi:hypothetical protein
MRVMLASYNELGSIPSLSISCHSLRRIDTSFSAGNPSGLGLFSFGRLFTAASISFCVIDLFR